MRSDEVDRCVALLLMLALWIGLYTTRSAIEEWSTYRQAFHLLPQVETAAAALQDHWPTKRADIPPGLHVIVTSRHPNALVVDGVDGRRSHYPFRESFGYLIDRSSNGVLRFKLSGAYDYQLEFHPSGSRPATYTDALGCASSPMIGATRLKDHWSLVRYGNK